MRIFSEYLAVVQVILQSVFMKFEVLDREVRHTNYSRRYCGAKSKRLVIAHLFQRGREYSRSQFGEYVDAKLFTRFHTSDRYYAKHVQKARVYCKKKKNVINMKIISIEEHTHISYPLNPRPYNNKTHCELQRKKKHRVARHFLVTVNRCRIRVPINFRTIKY